MMALILMALILVALILFAIGNTVWLGGAHVNVIAFWAGVYLVFSFLVEFTK